MIDGLSEHFMRFQQDLGWNSKAHPVGGTEIHQELKLWRLERQDGWIFPQREDYCYRWRAGATQPAGRIPRRA
jgi:hypothetical protein